MSGPFHDSRRRTARLRYAFSLVELLVVIGIITVLIAVLLPVLSRARTNAMKTQCLSNLRQIGVAFFAYQAENHGSYPVCTGWNVMGKKGATARYDIQHVGNTYRSDNQAKEGGAFTGWLGDSNIKGIRPLNKYLANKEVCHCPADRGDPRSDEIGRKIGYLPSCWDSFGTSYMVPWQFSVFGVAYVTADPDSTVRVSYDPPLPHLPLKAGADKDLTHKIIAGDWNWPKNRHINEPDTVWHHPFNPNGPRRMNILFGDGHAEDFTFPAWYETLDDGGTGDANGKVFAPDPSHGFW